MRYWAISVKQPWAALIASGKKTVEVRRWPTAYRGPVLIHAARVPDTREVGWSRLPEDVRELAKLSGGIIGLGVLADCKPYTNLDSFSADQAQHWNAPEWFDPRGLYGLAIRDAIALPFRRCPGQVRLFRVELQHVHPENSLVPTPHPRHLGRRSGKSRAPRNPCKE